MNIFVLDTNPKLCAQMHCDKHVVKMILEHAQMMCTTHHLHPSGYGRAYNIPYKVTHKNHPCTVWLRESITNYQWLYSMTYWLNEEYKIRFNHDVNHKSWDVIQSLPICPSIPYIGRTEFAQAMPDDYKDKNAVKAYRKYYNMDKIKLHKWTNSNTPEWIRSVLE